MPYVFSTPDFDAELTDTGSMHTGTIQVANSASYRFPSRM